MLRLLLQRPNGLQALGDVFLEAVGGGNVVVSISVFSRQIVLRDHAVVPLMRELVADPVAVAGLGSLVVGVAQMDRHLAGTLLPHSLQGRIDGLDGLVRLRRSGDVDDSLCQVDPCLGQAEELHGVCCGDGRLGTA